MKVILLRDIPKLGNMGAVVNVATGYARNYLLPQKLALEATDGNLKIFRERRKKIEETIIKREAEAEKIAQLLEEKIFTFRQKTTEEGKLYGSISAKEIALAIKNEIGCDVDKKRISLEPIKKIGNYTAEFNIYKDRKITLKIEVLPEETPAKLTVTAG